jgi:protein TonB
MSGTKRASSWALSVLLHSVVAVALLRVGYHYALPEGQVTEGIAIEAVGGGEPKAPAPKVLPAKPDKSEPAKFADAQPEKQAQQKVIVPPVVHEPYVDKTEDKQFNEPLPPVIKDTSERDSKVEPLEKEEPVKPEEKAEVVPVPVENPNQNQDQATAESEKQAGPPSATEDAGPPPGQPTGVRDISQMRQMPGNPKAGYPTVANLMRHEGGVVVLAWVRPNGSVDIPIVEKSSGSKYLDEEAVRTFGKFKFVAGSPGWVRQQFNFHLKGK